jgi:hypothetical protein
MKLDAVTAVMRPRSDWEAVDLGFSMVRRDFWRCFAVWWLAMAAPLGLFVFLFGDHPMMVLALFWWIKPAGSRMVLFELSRRLFGEEPRWRDVFSAVPQSFLRRFGYRFLWARFSPWLPVTQAVEDLEHLRGKVYRLRCRQLVERREGLLTLLYFLSDMAAVWFGMGIMALAVGFLPEGFDFGWGESLASWSMDAPFDIPALVSRVAAASVMLAMSLTDVFMVGAGFGIYLNNRTWIEGWDVELAFKRMAKRLAKSLMLLFLLICALGEWSVQAADRPPAERMREVKAEEAFRVHTVKEKVSKSRKSLEIQSDLVESILTIVVACAAAGFVGFVLWMLLKDRSRLRLAGRGKVQPVSGMVRVVMGLEVYHDSLPPDVALAAWELWRNGSHHEAVRLLYRGAISRVIEDARVGIEESDTEGDCLKRVTAAGEVAHPDYFKKLTLLWIRMAYGRLRPSEYELREMCRLWPFGGGSLA